MTQITQATSTPVFTPSTKADGAEKLEKPKADLDTLIAKANADAADAAAVAADTTEVIAAPLSEVANKA